MTHLWAKKISLLTLMGISLIWMPGISTTFADDGETQSTVPVIPKPDLLVGPEEEDSQDDVQSYFKNSAIPGFIEGFLGLTAGLALLGVIVGGIRFMTAYGNEEGITAGKKTAIWSVVGFGISMLAYAIVSIINTIAFPQVDEDDTGTTQTVETVDYEDI
jgi:hypothetical protein